MSWEKVADEKEESCYRQQNFSGAYRVPGSCCKSTLNLYKWTSVLEMNKFLLLQHRRIRKIIITIIII